MELNISQFFAQVDAGSLSASCAELGQNAGALTWKASIDSARDDAPAILDTDEKRQAFRVFVRSSGGWNDSEIAAWDDTKLEALCRQWIAGDMREPVGFELGPETTPEQWAEYQEQSEAGQVCGRIFRADDGAVYWYCGE